MRYFTLFICFMIYPVHASYDCDDMQNYSPLTQLVPYYEPYFWVEPAEEVAVRFIEPLKSLWKAVLEDNELILCGDIFMALMQ